MNILLRALVIGTAFFLFNVSYVSAQEHVKKTENVDFEIDFDALDEAIADFDIDQNIVIENPSKLTIFLRNLAAPLVIKLIVTLDFLKNKWKEIKYYLNKKLIKSKSTQEDDETQIFQT